jgi:hypothetical protein
VDALRAFVSGEVVVDVMVDLDAVFSGRAAVK